MHQHQPKPKPTPLSPPHPLHRRRKLHQQLHQPRTNHLATSTTPHAIPPTLPTHPLRNTKRQTTTHTTTQHPNNPNPHRATQPHTNHPPNNNTHPRNTPHNQQPNHQPTNQPQNKQTQPQTHQKTTNKTKQKTPNPNNHHHTPPTTLTNPNPKPQPEPRSHTPHTTNLIVHTRTQTTTQPPPSTPPNATDVNRYHHPKPTTKGKAPRPQHHAAHPKEGASPPESKPPPPARPHSPAGGSTHTLFSTDRGYPFPCRRAQERAWGCVHHSERAPPPSIFSLPRARNGGSATQQRMGRDTIVPPHYRYPAPKGASHTPTSPHQRREHASKQAGAKGRRDNDCPTTPSKRVNTKARKHHKRTRPARKHETQPPASKHAHTSLLFHHPREHKKRPHSSVWAQPSVSTTGEPWKSRRPARTKRRHTKRARRQRTRKERKQRGLRRVRLRPQERTAREKAAHNSPRQSAWVVVFVGVFADVCRLFEAGRLGGLGVFWGCLACFLVF